MTQTLKNLLTLAVFVILVGLGYYLFTQAGTGGLDITGSDTVSPDLLQKTQVFIERRSALDQVALETDFLTVAPFTTLRSYTTEIPDQTVGRSNIFDTAAPVPTVTPVVIE